MTSSATHQIVVLGGWETHAAGVDFLESVSSYQVFRHLAGDADDRNGVEFGVGQGRHDIGGSRSRGGKANCRFAGNPGHSLSDESGALFVTGQNMTNRFAFSENVVNGKIGASRDALPFEKGDHDFGSSVFHGVFSLSFELSRPGKKKPPPVVPAGVNKIGFF